MTCEQSPTREQSLTREQTLAQSFDKSMKLIELGASYNPIVPKRDGWNTTIVDHANRATLIKKYHDQNTNNIEEVDIVWQGGDLADAFPAHLHGTFDALIASHVGEHIPDIIGFLNSVAKILKPSGVLFLALPDKRRCFDFFRPIATTGDLLDGIGTSRHTRGTLYDNHAYFALRGDVSGWRWDGTYVPMRLASALETAKDILKTNTQGEYIDAHKWQFTPASFKLAILELNLLRVMPWAIARFQQPDGIEFYVWLEQREIQLSTDESGEQRLQLLRDMVMESKEEIAGMDPSAAPKSVPSISAIVPLYNGEKYITESLNSILSQTLPPKEIIVVDDGSTDNGPLMVKAMANHHPITLLTKINGGQSSARNYGVKHSTGDYIALLDQDDAWYPRHLERLVEPFKEPPNSAELGWVYSNLDEVDVEGLMICKSFLSTIGRNYSKRDVYNLLVQDMFILPSASLISRKAFDSVGGFDERLSGYEDDDLFLRLFRKGYDNIFIDEALSKWRIYPESSSYTYRMRRSRAVYMRKLLEAYPDDPAKHRYFTQHLILPRFYAPALGELKKALLANDAAMIEEMRNEVQFITSKMTSRRRRFVGHVFGMMKSPAAIKMAFAARERAIPILRKVM